MGSSKPLVSVVIPAHNAESFLAASIDSVNSQSTQELECIVVDDGSTDATARVASQYGTKVRYHWQVRQGVAAARNTGLGLARGEYVAFLDADDVWLSTKLGRQLAYMREEGALASMCGFFAVDRNLRVLKRQGGRIHKGLKGLLAFQHSGGIGSTLLASRTLLHKIGGFDRRLSTSADWELLARLLLEGHVAVVEEPLMLYRQHGTNMHQNVAVMEHDMLIAFDTIFGDQRLDPTLKADEPRFRAILHKVLGASYYKTGRTGAAFRHGARVVLLYPRYIPYLVWSRMFAWLRFDLVRHVRPLNEEGRPRER